MFTAFILTSIASLATGSSWAIVTSLGLALGGIATGLGIPLPMAAGAIVSGCFLGDKWSPLSDTPNLSAASTGQNIIKLFKSMVPTSGFGAILAAVGFLVLGFIISESGSANSNAVVKLMNGLSSSFNLNILLVLPVIFVFVMAAFTFAGFIEKIGVLDAIMEKLIRIIKSTRSLIICSLFTSIATVYLSPSVYVSIILNGRMYDKAYRKKNLDIINLSRTITEGSAYFGGMCPWSGGGLLVISSLGVSPWAYVPYVFGCWGAIVFTIVWAYTGKYIPKTEYNEKGDLTSAAESLQL